MNEQESWWGVYEADNLLAVFRYDAHAVDWANTAPGDLTVKKVTAQEVVPVPKE